MKKIIFLFTTIVLSVSSFAQSERYTQAMKTNISKLESANATGSIQELANSFERIAEAEKTQWLPYYYASYCHIMHALTTPDKNKVDAMADRADQLIQQAENLAGKENSETAVIKSMIASAHMMVDPQNRWQQYGEASNTNLVKAKTLDPMNPRPVILEAQAKFYTPEAFGGSKAQAKELFAKANQMFDTFKPQSELHPNWGKASIQYFMSQSN